MSTRVVVAPIEVDVDGAKCTILEITSHEWIDGSTRYVVSAYCEYKGLRSKVFQLDVASNKELINKLRIEVAKMKLDTVLGYDHLYTKVF